MEIIKHGNKHKKEYQGTCHNCGSIMRERENKLEVEEDPKEGIPFACANCPVCGQRVVFYPAKDRKMKKEIQ